MTHSGLARMLDRARGLASDSPTPDAEIPDERADAVIEAVKEAVTPVAEAIAAKTVTPEPEPEEGVTNVTPPAVFVSEREAPAKAPKPKPEGPPEPASFRQKRMISWLGMVRVGNELRKIKMLTDDLDEREIIDASWDKELASECIDALTKGMHFTHPAGWRVYLNRTAYDKYRASKS